METILLTFLHLCLPPPYLCPTHLFSPPHLHFTKSNIFLFNMNWCYFHFTSKSFKSIFGFNHHCYYHHHCDYHHSISPPMCFPFEAQREILLSQCKSQTNLDLFPLNHRNCFNKKDLNVLAKWFLAKQMDAFTSQNIVTSNSAKNVRSCRAKDPQRRQTKQMICTVKKWILNSSQTFYFYSISHIFCNWIFRVFLWYLIVLRYNCLYLLQFPLSRRAPSFKAKYALRILESDSSFLREESSSSSISFPTLTQWGRES